MQSITFSHIFIHFLKFEDGGDTILVDFKKDIFLCISKCSKSKYDSTFIL